MPYFNFQKPKGPTKWKLSGRFEDHKQACTARDHHTTSNIVARMVKADTEGEARGKTGVTWNAITNDSGR